MAFALAFLKRYKKHIKRVFAVMALSALTAVLIFAFREGVMQNVIEDDAFGTVYAFGAEE